MEWDKNDESGDWLLRISPQVHLVGYHHAPSGWSDGGRVIADYALQAAGPGGQLTVRAEDKLYHCPHGTFIIVPPDVWVLRSGPTHRPFTRYWVHFDWVFREEWPVRPWRQDVSSPEQAGGFGRPVPPFVPGGVLQGEIPHPGRFFQDFERLNERFHFGSPGERLSCRGLLLEMLSALLAPVEQAPADVPPPAARRVRQALRRLADVPFAQAPPIRKYLASLGGSYDHQARVFRQAFGQTPLAYVNSLRMARARALLADTDYPIKQIAHELGFVDVGYFDRLFRKHAGLSPAAFRRASDQA